MFQFKTLDQQPYVMGNAPLVRAVVQVVFAASPRLVTPQSIGDLQDSLGDDFESQVESAQQPGVQISIGVPPSIVFAHKDGYVFSLNAQSITLVIDERYESRAAFSELFASVLECVGRIGKIKDYQRLAVRYINAAPATVNEFVTWFKPEFTGWAGGKILAEDALRTWILMTQFQRQTDDSPVTAGIIRYGYIAGGVGLDVTQSEAASKPSFLADIDLLCARPGPYSATQLAELYRLINHEIAAFFKNSLSDAGLSHFALAPKD